MGASVLACVPQLLLAAVGLMASRGFSALASREPWREGKILSDYGQDGNVTVLIGGIGSSPSGLVGKLRTC